MPLPASDTPGTSTSHASAPSSASGRSLRTEVGAVAVVVAAVAVVVAAVAVVVVVS